MESGLLIMASDLREPKMSDSGTQLSDPVNVLAGHVEGDQFPFGSAPTVIYDGQCNFCISQIKNLKRLDLWRMLQFVSLHDPLVAKACPDLSYEQLMEEMWIVTPDGSKHGGSKYGGSKYGGADALRYLSRKLPLLWPLAPLLHIPGSRPLWAWMYRNVAQRRYAIAGKNCSEGTCSLHGRKS
jgi:predicted DCC family thiol-disulfide oxidoreductase YuxK